MSRRGCPIINLTWAAAPLIIIACLAFPAPARSKNASQSAAAAAEKAAQILQRAVEALGGSNYLNVRSVIGRGLFTPFKDGKPDLPSMFVDYIVYPDRERTEFRAPAGRIIQTNAGDGGWLYDGAAKSIKDMTPAQVEDYQLSLRTSVENLLRGWWRKGGARLSYIGRREAGLARRNEAVRLTYPDGFAVEFEFGARDGLPAKVIYKRKNSEGEEVSEEERLAKPISIGGITTPFVVDHYRAGVQTSRTNYESVEYNPRIPDSLFARPANVKAVK